MTGDRGTGTLRLTMSTLSALFRACIEFCIKRCAEGDSPLFPPWLAGLGLVVLLLPGARADEAVSGGGQPQVLVLRNGEVFNGKVARNDDHYVVQLPHGQVRLKNADVEMVCDNLLEAYRRKRAAIRADDAGQHLELAEWCLHQQLLVPAAAELATVAHADPENPMIGELRHRIKMAKEPSPTADGKGAVPPVGNDELDRTVRSLPRGSVEMFTQLVQPVLMNNCMSAGCHGLQNEQGLQLFRVSLGKTSGRRLTQRNLYAVLQYVDRESPAESRLLKAIQGPHGTSRSPIFSDRQAAQYQRIVNWVDMVANQPETVVPASVALPPGEDPPTLSTPRPRIGLRPRTLPPEARRATSIQAADARAFRTARTAAANPRAHGRANPSNPSADPFDPEVFNHLPAGKP